MAATELSTPSTAPGAFCTNMPQEGSAASVQGMVAKDAVLQCGLDRFPARSFVENFVTDEKQDQGVSTASESMLPDDNKGNVLHTAALADDGDADGSGKQLVGNLKSATSESPEKGDNITTSGPAEQGAAVEGREGQAAGIPEQQGRLEASLVATTTELTPSEEEVAAATEPLAYLVDDSVVNIPAGLTTIASLPSVASDVGAEPFPALTTLRSLVSSPEQSVTESESDELPRQEPAMPVDLLSYRGYAEAEEAPSAVFVLITAGDEDQGGDLGLQAGKLVHLSENEENIKGDERSAGLQTAFSEGTDGEGEEDRARLQVSASQSSDHAYLPAASELDSVVKEVGTSTAHEMNERMQEFARLNFGIGAVRAGEAQALPLTSEASEPFEMSMMEIANILSPRGISQAGGRQQASLSSFTASTGDANPAGSRISSATENESYQRVEANQFNVGATGQAFDAASVLWPDGLSSLRYQPGDSSGENNSVDIAQPTAAEEEVALLQVSKSTKEGHGAALAAVKAVFEDEDF